MDLTNALRLLREQIDQVDDLKKPPSYNTQYKTWNNTTKKILQGTFSSDLVERFNHAGPNQIAQSDHHLYQIYLGMLDDKKQLIKDIIQENERIARTQKAAKAGSKPFKSHPLHPEIDKVSSELLHDGHFSHAAAESFKRVINEVKAHMVRKGNDIYDGGDTLMNHAFGTRHQDPPIKFTSLDSIEEEDEQEGIMFLFKGIVPLRNKKALDRIVLDRPETATEYLILASLLMRLLDLSDDYDG